VVAVAAGAACSQSYAEGSKPADDAGAEASAEDAQVDAEVDAFVADNAVPPVPSFTELATGLVDLAGIAATETDVYFTEREPGNVRSVPIGGGAVATLATASGAPGPIAIAGGHLFWANVGGKQLSRRPLVGAAVPLVASTSTTVPHALAAGADRIFVIALGPQGVGEAQQYDFDFVAGPVVGGLSNPFDVAVDGSAAYWTESSTGRIGRGANGSALNDTVATGETGCEAIAANAAGAYWTRPSDGLVRAVSIQSFGVTSLAEKEVSPSSIAADDGDVYWLTGDGTVRRKRVGQELPPATIANGFKSAFAGTRVRALALTSKYVVWLTSDGRILRADK